MPFGSCPSSVALALRRAKRIIGPREAERTAAKSTDFLGAWVFTKEPRDHLTLPSVVFVLASGHSTAGSRGVLFPAGLFES